MDTGRSNMDSEIHSELAIYGCYVQPLGGFSQLVIWLALLLPP